MLVVTACGASASRAPASSGPPAYLVLFERGRSWTLSIETTHGRKQGERFAASSSERGNVTCEVSEVKQIGDANVARVSCKPPHAGLLVVGTWVATPAGLYHPALPIDDADELAMLGEDDLLLSAKPRDREHSHALGDAQDSVEAFSFKRSWCVRNTITTESDRRAYTLCFDATGVTGGGEVIIVGADSTWHRTHFGAAPPDPDDPTSPHDD